MAFNLLFTEKASKNLDYLENNSSTLKQLKSVKKALGYLESNPKHPRLNTHKCSSFHGKNGEEIFEAYAENNTPAAYRIFWHYGPGKKEITVVAIVPHP